MARKKKLYKILSINGGGIRGLVAGVIISEIEKKLKIRDGESAKITDYFDLIAGTSTGSILSLMYRHPDKKYDAIDAVNLYLENEKDKYKRTEFDIKNFPTFRELFGMNKF